MLVIKSLALLGVLLWQLNNLLHTALKYAVKDVSEGSEYEFRVSAINMSGAGEPSAPSVMVCAKNPNSKSVTLSGNQENI